MTKLQMLLNSRTFWTVVVIVLGNILNVKYHFFSANLTDCANVILGTLASYFHVTPSQDYTSTPTPEV